MHTAESGHSDRNSLLARTDAGACIRVMT
jgi:hypothetical protein